MVEYSDSGTYTSATLARRAKIAEKLLEQGTSTAPVGHWAQGLARLAQAGFGGYELGEAERKEQAETSAAMRAVFEAQGIPASEYERLLPKREPSPMDRLFSAFTGGGATVDNPAVAAPEPPLPPPTAGPRSPSFSPVETLPAGKPATGSMYAGLQGWAPDERPMEEPLREQSLDAMMPRQAVAAALRGQPASIRNNNPGAQWPGPSALAFGASGAQNISGGNKIASFPDAVSGGAAQFDLLARNYAGMSLSAAIAKWSGGDNAGAYVRRVSAATGLSPDTVITPELLRSPQGVQLVQAMAQHEAGKPFPMSGEQWQEAQSRAFDPQGRPPAASADGPLPARGVGPISAPVGRAGGVPANRAAIAAALMNPRLPPGMRQVLAAQLAPSNYGFQTLPDGTIVRTDPRGGTVTPIYQGATKPTFGVIGEKDGEKIHGWIDPVKGTTTPSQVPGSGSSRSVTLPSGEVIEAPQGVDLKKFREHASAAVADAMSGKLTETQAKDTRFANRMEKAEGVMSTFEEQGLSGWGKTMEAGGLPVLSALGNFAQTKEYQQYKTARDNFITALLRDESGAAIGTTEFARMERELFPQPGDGADVLRQKREMRAVAIDGMKKGAGLGYKSPAAPAAKPATASAPKDGDTATNPRTKERVQFRNGQWVPLQ